MQTGQAIFPARQWVAHGAMLEAVGKRPPASVAGIGVQVRKNLIHPPELGLEHLLRLRLVERREDVLGPGGELDFHGQGGPVTHEPVGVAQTGEKFVLYILRRPEAVEIEAARPDFPLRQLGEADFTVHVVAVHQRAQITVGVLNPLHFAHERDFFLSVAEAEHARLATADQSRGLERLEAEHNYLRAALDFALAQNGETSVLLRLVSSLMGFWMFRGYLRERADYLASALTRLEAEPADAAPEAAHRAGRAALLSGAAEIAFTRGDLVNARAQMESCVALRRALGDPRGIALALNNLGNIASGLNDLVVARALYEESLALQRELNHTIGIARTLNNLGALVARAQDPPSSYDLFAESLSLRRQVGDPRGIGIALVNLDNILCDLNRREEARACYVERLTLCQDLGEKNGIAYALDGFADLARAENRVVDAARLYGAASALREKAEIRLPPSEQARQERGVHAAQSVAGKTAFADAFAAGKALSWEEACRFALQEPSV